MSDYDNTPSPRILPAILATGACMWVVAGLWHNLVVPALYAGAGHASHDGIGVLLVAYLILAGIMGSLYVQGRRGGRPRPLGEALWDGLCLGALVGLLWVFPHELALAGAHGDPLLYVSQNAAWHAVEQGIGGVVLAAIAR